MKTYDFNTFAKKFMHEWLDSNQITYQTQEDSDRPGIITFVVSDKDSVAVDALLAYKLELRP